MVDVGAVGLTWSLLLVWSCWLRLRRWRTLAWMGLRASTLKSEDLVTDGACGHLPGRVVADNAGTTVLKALPSLTYICMDSLCLVVPRSGPGRRPVLKMPATRKRLKGLFRIS